MSIPRFSVNNPIAANFLMIFMLLGGSYYALTLPRELMPAFEPNMVNVTVMYPGSTPVDVEKGIIIKIEEAIHDLDDVKRITSNASEGSGSVNVEFETGTDIDQAVNDVKAAIDRLRNVPFEVREIVVRKMEMTMPVLALAVYGETTERNLREISENLRDELLELGDVTKVEVSGVREPEIAIEVHPGMLEKYQLTFQDVAREIGEDNIDMPAGQLKATAGDIRLRTMGERKDIYALEEIIIRSDPNGQTVRLKDVATVTDGFKEVIMRGRFNGKPAAQIMISKTADQDAIEIATAVKKFVADKQPEFSGAIKLATRGDSSEFIRGNLNLLIRSAMIGLVLVLLSLTLFLSFRIAFWTAVGIPVALLGTFIIMNIVGLTTNLMTFFGLIVILGMVVDDAIVLGENVFRRYQEGLSPREAAIQGSEEIALPVLATIMTTVAAFSPFLFAQGDMSSMNKPLATVIIAALLCSLVEAFVILPSHLAGALTRLDKRKARAKEKVQKERSRAFKIVAHVWGFKDRVIDQHLRSFYLKALDLCVEWRYVSLSASIVAFLIVIVMIMNGRPQLVMMQDSDGEMIQANLEMLPGTPVEGTMAALRRIEEAAMGLDDVRSVYSVVGEQVNFSGWGGGGQAEPAAMGQVLMELNSIEERDRHSDLIISELRSRVQTIPGAASLKFEAVSGKRGDQSDFELRVRSEDSANIGRPISYIKSKLSEYEGVVDVRDNMAAGKLEAQVSLNALGRISGLTVSSLAANMRSAVFGAEAQMLQRGRDEVEVQVRLTKEARDSLGDLEHLRIATPDGGRVPFSELGTLETSRGSSMISRLDRKRTVKIEADLDENNSNVTALDISNRLAADLANIGQLFPGVSVSFGGVSERMAESFSSLLKNFGFACLLIYAILALVFRSYLQPIIIMFAVPFGLIGAALGHVWMGYPMTMVSWMGLIALSGVVVNDSLILVDFINRSRNKGLAIKESIMNAGRVRLRPIILTSITTILGLVPLLMAQAYEAQMLIPMAISLAFGLAFATVLTLLIVPCLYAILDDMVSMFSSTMQFMGFKDAPAASE
jgi:multidrug efflux pump subunit AcrB